MSMFINPNIQCEQEAESFMARARFAQGTDLNKVKQDMIESCVIRRNKEIDQFNKAISPSWNYKEKLTKPAIRPRPTQEMPKPQPMTTQELPAKKDGKLDTNQLLLLGLGAIIIILLIKK